MEWRCVRCGRPHATNSPPCNCGCVEFEEAVVRLTQRCTACGAPAGDDEDVCRECGFQSLERLDAGPTAGDVDSSYVQWRCPECGKTAPRNAPPCDRCGNMHLERERLTDDDVDVDAYIERTPVFDASDWRVVGAVAFVLVLLALSQLL